MWKEPTVYGHLLNGGHTMEIAHRKQQKHLVAKSLMINKLISFTFHGMHAATASRRQTFRQSLFEKRLNLEKANNREICFIIQVIPFVACSLVRRLRILL